MTTQSILAECRANYIRISEMVKNKRKSLGETQTQFGNRFGVTHVAISDLENGKTQSIDENMLNFIMEKQPITKQSILQELRANPDKIFHLLRERDFERAKKLFGSRNKMIGRGVDSNLIDKYERWNYEYHMQQLVIAPDVLGYLESYGKEGE